MDIYGLLSRAADLLFNHTWGLVGALFVIFIIVLIWVAIPKPKRWHCSRCGERFYDEESAAGHVAVHASHKTVLEQD